MVEQSEDRCCCKIVQSWKKWRLSGWYRLFSHSPCPFLASSFFLAISFSLFFPVSLSSSFPSSWLHCGGALGPSLGVRRSRAGVYLCLISILRRWAEGRGSGGGGVGGWLCYWYYRLATEQVREHEKYQLSSGLSLRLMILIIAVQVHYRHHHIISISFISILGILSSSPSSS